MKDKAFFDDSSRSLGLNHSYRTDRIQQDAAELIEIRTSIFASGAVDWIVEHLRGDDAGRHLQPADRESLAFQRYQEMRTDAIRVRVKEYVEVRGKNLVDAMMLAEGDIAKQDRVSEQNTDNPVNVEEYADPPRSVPWSEKKITELMRAPVKPHGGGSRSGKRNKKPPKKDGRGRPYVEYDEPRDVQRTLKMTASTESAIDSTGYKTNDIMAAVGRAILEGKTLAEIVGHDILREVTARSVISDSENNTAA